jgi:hypothetical protein
VRSRQKKTAGQKERGGTSGSHDRGFRKAHLLKDCEPDLRSGKSRNEASKAKAERCGVLSTLEPFCVSGRRHQLPEPQGVEGGRKAKQTEVKRTEATLSKGKVR